MNEVDAYIAAFAQPVRDRLEAVRAVIVEKAPAAAETICMRMPTYVLNGKWLVHFAGWKKHIGFYPGASGVEIFADRLTEYGLARGAVRFPPDRALPLALIREIVRFLVAESNVAAERRAKGES